MNKITEAITAHWGERCPDNEPGCPCCDAWAEFDALTGQLNAVLSLIADSDIPRAEAKKLAAAIRAMKTGDK